MARQKPLYAVFDGPMLAQPGFGPPQGVSFKTQTWKPRWVCDLRYMEDASHSGLMAGIRRYYLRRAREPEALRVSAKTYDALEAEAKRLAKPTPLSVMPPPITDIAPDRTLTFMGIKVTR